MKTAYINGIILNGHEDMVPTPDLVVLVDGKQSLGLSSLVWVVDIVNAISQSSSNMGKRAISRIAEWLCFTRKTK